jgi:hypothetical protein
LQTGAAEPVKIGTQALPGTPDCCVPDGGHRRQEVCTFGTTTRELLRLADWLTAAGCTHVAMESTGVYWRPVYNLLEGSSRIRRCSISYGDERRRPR